ncbi:MAG: LysM peptidoglycan-binding domain-containing protein [Polyangiales bacterium]
MRAKLIGWIGLSAVALTATHASAQSVTLGSSASAGRFVPNTHTVRDGDTLWDITGQYFGNPYEWPRVWSYNPAVTNPHWIYPGSQIALKSTATGSMPPDNVNTANTTAASSAGSNAPGSVYLREMGFLDEDALKNEGLLRAAQVDHLLLSVYDKVYIDFEKDAAITPGSYYTIFRHLSKDEREKSEKGELVRILGTVRLDEYDEDSSLGRGEIVEALDTIERGFRVAPIMRRFSTVTPQPAQVSLETSIIASIYPRKILAQHHVVFIGAGSEQGIVLGQSVSITRSGDEWQDSTRKLRNRLSTTVPIPKEPEKYPVEVVAKGQVVGVRPQTSAVMITESIRTLEYGDRVMSYQGR